jgi:hypothetical protein
MSLVKNWINGFLRRHKARFAPGDWPTGEDSEEVREFVKTWVTAFATRQVTEAEADEASQALGANPPNFRREHLQAVVGRIEATRNAQGGQGGASTREAAKEQSRGCGSCGSEGLASVFHPFPSHEHKISASVAAYCVCAHGRWIKRAHSEKNPELLRKIPDLGDVLEGRTGWLASPPDCPNLDAFDESEVGATL